MDVQLATTLPSLLCSSSRPFRDKAIVLDKQSAVKDKKMLFSSCARPPGGVCALCSAAGGGLSSLGKLVLGRVSLLGGGRAPVFRVCNGAAGQVVPRSGPLRRALSLGSVGALMGELGAGHRLVRSHEGMAPYVLHKR